MSDKVLYENEHVSLKIRDDWYYYMSSPPSARLVYVLGYMTSDFGYMVPNLVLGRFENCPVHEPVGKIGLTSLSGTIEPGENPIDAAVREIHEESGFEIADIMSREMLSLGVAYISKSMDTVAHMFAINLSGLTMGDPVGDGTLGEQGAYCEWVSVKRATVESACVVVPAMIQRARELGLIG